MSLTAFDIDSPNGTRRTVILACAATDATVFVDRRHPMARGRILDHADGSHRTLASAHAARLASELKTVMGQHHRIADADRGFVRRGDTIDSASWADLAATHTRGTTVIYIVLHLRLHESLQVGRRTQNMRRAFGNTKLTSRAIVGKILQSGRSERLERHITLRETLLLDGGQTAVETFFLSRNSRSHCNGSRSRKHFATFGTLFRQRIGNRSLLFATSKRDSPLLTVVDTVHTDHTTGIIDSMVIGIDTHRLAIAGTFLTAVAFGSIDRRNKQRIARHEAKQGPHRAHRIAPETAIEESQQRDKQSRNSDHNQHDRSRSPCRHRIEKLAHHTSIQAIGSNEHSQGIESDKKHQNKNSHQRVPQHV